MTIKRITINIEDDGEPGVITVDENGATVLKGKGIPLKDMQYVCSICHMMQHQAENAEDQEEEYEEGSG